MVRRSKELIAETRRQITDAARIVFHRMGVNRSSLEMVARVAGLTRGAIYWHFKDKAELFLAVREAVLLPMVEEIEALISPAPYSDPLNDIETVLRRFFQILDDDTAVRMVLETIAHRCEQVAEFADVRLEMDGLAARCVNSLESTYRQASVAGTLRPGLEPELIARDTWAFAYGLMYQLLAGKAEGGQQNRVRQLISCHMALRRIPGQPAEQKGRVAHPSSSAVAVSSRENAGQP